uniref:C2H2-type domain-containing protein n=1 Tax=Caenorhabditis tropicalis TaxID=1561998 RepID=A0A1I7ULP1_9PELO
MDQLEFFKQLTANTSTVPVKEEEPDQPMDFQQAARASNTPPPGLDEPDEEEGEEGEGEEEEEVEEEKQEEETEAPLLTGVSAMTEEIEAAAKKEAEITKKLVNFMMREEPPAKKQKRKVEEERSSRREEEVKPPLTTFGHSSRPRRSVNYASIERGDEAQSQSLVQDFGSGKKRTKRTRDELDENYDQAKETRRRGRPTNRNYIPNNSTMASARTIVQTVRSAEDEFRAVAPKPGDERPDPSKRDFLQQLDEFAPIRRASGGFRRFVLWFSDEAALQLLEVVKRRCNLTTENDIEQLVQALRHVYNSMSKDFRREWEKGARSDIQESNKFLGTNLVMPMSEILAKDALRDPKLKPAIAQGVRPNCCSARPLLANMLQTIEHYLQHHDIVHFFGCDFCFKVFPTRYELTKHECPEFTGFMYELVTKGLTLTLEAAYMYLCCTQCGVWLPVKANITAMKGWTYFATTMTNHTCKPLAAIVVFFRKPLPEEGKHVRMMFQVIPHIDIGFPMSCNECGIEEFETFAEIEEHFKTAPHKGFPCLKCPKKFGTQFALRHHQNCHMSSSAQFANYLLYSATYEPPPSASHPRYIGFNTEIPVFGGRHAAELQMLESCQPKDLVDPKDLTFRRKIYLWKDPRAKKKEQRESTSDSKDSSPFELEPGESSGEEDFQKALRKKEKLPPSPDLTDSGDDSDAVTSNRKKNKVKKPIKMRGNLGYEHIDTVEFFEKSEAEQEARRRLSEVLEIRTLEPFESLRNPKRVLKTLEDAQEVLLPPIGCKLADEVAAFTMRTVLLPAANCIDPLKDCMCLNKIFVYCDKCTEVVNQDVQTHAIECQASEDQITEVYHAAAGPHAGLRCIFPDCKAHLCSAIGLRFHLFNEHNKQVSLASETSVAVVDEYSKIRYDRSLMGTAKHFTSLQLDDRSFLARMTDADCFLPFSGLLEGRLQPRPPPPPLPVAIATKRNLQYAIPPVPAPEYRPAASAADRPSLNAIRQQQQQSSRVKPYRVPRTNRWYACFWCERQYDSIDQFIDHLVKTHSIICLACGRCFSSANAKRTHVCLRTFSDSRKPGTSLSGNCPTCEQTFPIESLYVHQLRRHFHSIDYIHATGELFPVGRDLGIRPNAAFHPAKTPKPPGPIRSIQMDTEYTAQRHEERAKKVRPGLPPCVGVPFDQIHTTLKAPPAGMIIRIPNPQSIDTRLMCYLCELTFANVDELTAHLDEHPEKWKNCPLCGFDVADHYELHRHLLTAHVIKISNALCCAFCQETHRFMGSHMIYQCKRVARCTICGQKSNDPAANRLHMQRTHSLALRRFQCTFCAKLYGSVGEYYEHECPAGGGRVYACSCSPDKHFATPTGYFDHFDSIHVTRNVCRICNQDMVTTDGMLKHRLSHMRSQPGKDQQKKLFVLMHALFPKPDSGYAMWQEHGGPTPRSFEDVDRSKEFMMMGNLGPIPLATLQSYSSPPPTLSDILGKQFAPSSSCSTAPATTLQRVVQSRIHQGSSTPEVVTLESDGEDDCVLVVEKPTSEFFLRYSNPMFPEVSESTSPETPIAVDREVRIESSQDGYETSVQQPGYVADDDLEVADEGSDSPAGQPVVKEIVDDNADDELAVVAEVENAAGTLPSSVSAGRERKFKCNACSMSYFTNNALEVHKKDHKLDAGSTTCSETYGIPLVTPSVWICRNCCIAFEDQKTHAEHLRVHGSSSGNCPECSGIAFNNMALTSHQTAHAENRVKFSCGTCLFVFTSDLQLMDHLMMAHSIGLFYFCKLCNFGSTNADRVYMHIGTHGNQPYTLAQRFGACPAQLLNYTPTDEKAFRIQLLHKKVTLTQPSDCTHRALLLNNENSVTCRTCHCTQSYFNFLAHNNYSKETEMPSFKQIHGEDDRFPLWRHLNEKNANMMIRCGNIHQNHMPQHSAAPAHHRNPAILSRPPVPLPRGAYQPAPVVSMTSNGVRVIKPHQQALGPPPPREPMMMARRIVVPGTARIGVGGQVTVQPPPIRTTNNVTAVTTRCRSKECDKLLTSEFDRQLHTMHTSENSWFCRQCGRTQKTEMELVQHYISQHLTASYNKFHEHGFKSVVHKLTCPIPSCHGLELQSLKLFEKHMNKEHTKELPFEAECCDARFATKERLDRHEKLHAAYVETNGTDSSCCTICGTLDMWQLPKDTRIDCLQSHTIRHGLDYRSSCRSCLKQFDSDIDQSQAIAHCRQEHGLVMPEAPLTICKLCNRGGMSEDKYAEHCKTYHVFNILCKAQLSVRGELVVTLGEEYERYVGMERRHRSSTSQSSSSSSSKNQQSSTSSTTPQISSANGGNAALLSIAAAIGESSSSTRMEEDDDVMTLD